MHVLHKLVIGQIDSSLDEECEDLKGTVVQAWAWGKGKAYIYRCGWR